MSMVPRLSGQLAPVQDAITKHGGAPELDAESDATVLGHRPNLGAKNYRFVIFPGASADLLARYESIHALRIPESYRSILMMANGLKCWELALYGFPHSMANQPPVLDRQGLQPFDLSTANSTWKISYALASEMFLFGGRHYDLNQNCGFFLLSDGACQVRLTDGGISAQYNSVSALLKGELPAAEAFSIAHVETTVRSNPPLQRTRQKRARR